ncbi:Uncharacterized protein APZ42_025406 [Daphnia magna]|uniref:Uncharacterized protein n=1 Tax=Daphnia magna TaxID=35525 RepID=A0A164T4I7_9CRUS|nr:Uncharacterized protein APZ42_025406 [Daphnia magna]
MLGNSIYWNTFNYLFKFHHFCLVVYIARAFLRRNQASIDPMPFFQEPVVWTIETMMKCPKYPKCPMKF